MKLITAIQARIVSTLAILGLASGCGDLTPSMPKATTTLTPSAQKKISKHFNVTKPGTTTMRLGTQEGGGDGT